ncbi:gpW family head-tail joining protein [Sphingomonas sp. CARO-RG-8B-R24-01]|uniref:gpW family head-tail joining protein n=1 Tax=Sphingomonas sp. CARO-RG-8B-R24-01 TaxID=2914831 RepID=UPI001F55E91B|nr:gpW family head-tail joining protein [Sphingomonas sp. CARO-RG-8B-R24-01]
MSVFDGMSQAQLRAALASAQAALIDLQMGRSIVSLSYAQGDGSKSVTRKMGTVGECTALILQLQRALGIGRPRRSIGFVFR